MALTSRSLTALRAGVATRIDTADMTSLPMLGLLVVIVTWGVASPLLKLSSLSGPALSFYRLWIGVAVLFALSGEARRLFRSDALRYAVPAGALFGANILFFIAGVKTTTVANATLIGALQPAITLLVAGRLFGEVVTGRQVACVALAIFGVAVVIAGSSGVPEWHPVGDAFAVAAVLTFTVYFLISKQARSTVGTLEYMAGVHLAAALIVTPFAAADARELVSFEPKDYFVVGFFALVSGTLGQVVVGWTHRYIDVSLSSLMLLGVPVVAAASAWAMLDESLVPLQIAGGVVTLAAIAAMIRRPLRQAAPAEGWEGVPSSGGGDRPG